MQWSATARQLLPPMEAPARAPQQVRWMSRTPSCKPADVACSCCSVLCMPKMQQGAESVGKTLMYSIDNLSVISSTTPPCTTVVAVWKHGGRTDLMSRCRCRAWRCHCDRGDRARRAKEVATCRGPEERSVDSVVPKGTLQGGEGADASAAAGAATVMPSCAAALDALAAAACTAEDATAGSASCLPRRPLKAWIPGLGMAEWKRAAKVALKLLLLACCVWLQHSERKQVPTISTIAARVSAIGYAA